MTSSAVARPRGRARTILDGAGGAHRCGRWTARRRLRPSAARPRRPLAAALALVAFVLATVGSPVALAGPPPPSTVGPLLQLSPASGRAAASFTARYWYVDGTGGKCPYTFVEISWAGKLVATDKVDPPDPKDLTYCSVTHVFGDAPAASPGKYAVSVVACFIDGNGLKQCPGSTLDRRTYIVLPTPTLKLRPGAGPATAAFTATYASGELTCSHPSALFFWDGTLDRDAGPARSEDVQRRPGPAARAHARRRRVASDDRPVVRRADVRRGHARGRDLHRDRPKADGDPGRQPDAIGSAEPHLVLVADTADLVLAFAVSIGGRGASLGLVGGRQRHAGPGKPGALPRRPGPHGPGRAATDRRSVCAGDGRLRRRPGSRRDRPGGRRDQPAADPPARVPVRADGRDLQQHDGREPRRDPRLVAAPRGWAVRHPRLADRARCLADPPGRHRADRQHRPGPGGALPARARLQPAQPRLRAQLADGRAVRLARRRARLPDLLPGGFDESPRGAPLSRRTPRSSCTGRP